MEKNLSHKNPFIINLILDELFVFFQNGTKKKMLAICVWKKSNKTFRTRERFHFDFCFFGAAIEMKLERFFPSPFCTYHLI